MKKKMKIDWVLLKRATPTTDWPHPSRQYRTAKNTGDFTLFQKKSHKSCFKVQAPGNVDKCITLYLANKSVPACLMMDGPQFLFKPGHSFINILIYN